MPLRRWLKSLRVRPLAGRLLVYVLAFSLVVSAFAAGMQLYSEYQEERRSLAEMQRKLANMLGPSLANGLWYLNLAEVNTILEGTLEIPTIQLVRLVTAEGQEFQFGKLPEGPAIEQQFSLSVERPEIIRREAVGELILSSSLAPLQSRLFSRGLATLLFQSLIVLIGTLGLMLIVRLTLTRHLESMASYASRLDFEQLLEPLSLRRRPPAHPDELSELERALNSMRVKLLEEARDLREAELASQNERDEAIRANRAKNLFLANVSHELRTPLQSVLGYALLLDDTQLDPEQREYLKTLRMSAENLSSIINDLLDISRMEAGKLSLEQIAFDIRDTLNDVMLMLGPKAREKGLAFELRIDETLPAALLGDPARLRQVLLNLVANAIKFTDSGHVLVSIEVLGRQQDKLNVRLAVEDTGIGIAREDLPLIYEPYVQLAPRFRRPAPGAGLGLTICRQLVSLMQGSLDVESRPGQGTTFWVELSYPIAPEAASRVRPDISAIRGKRLLVADSYALSRKITLELLGRMEADVEAARSAAEAILALRQASDAQRPFDIVILDGFLPDMDSDLLCQQIRDQRNWASTRILILSSNPQRGDAEHFRQAGADGFLSKALRESCLGPLLQRVLLDREQGLRGFVTRFTLQPNTGQRSPAMRSHRRLAILLVEDNPVNRTLTRRLLEKLGCEVTTAEDGEQASQLWPLRNFDLIFMDCLMPRLDGFEATQRLRDWERRHHRRPVPVIALTASAMEKDEERSRRVGMNAFLAKPVNLETLRAVVDQMCHTHIDL